jgi:hypothetical protein
VFLTNKGVITHFTNITTAPAGRAAMGSGENPMPAITHFTATTGIGRWRNRSPFHRRLT